MHLTFGEDDGVGAAAVSLYTERYPQLPNPCTFPFTDRRIRETGTISPAMVDH
jgi:hypothetical protein